jgi:PLP dependent protein
MMIAQNLIKLEEIIEKKCSALGRDRSNIKLIAVSKTQSVDLIKEAVEAGIIHFGENKAQELRDKTEIIKDPLCWHYIGYLQSNKIKYVIRAAEFIHSVDSYKLAEEINSRAESINKRQKILLEFKTSKEDTKTGISSESELFDIADKCSELKNIDLVGLMTIAPYTDNENLIRKAFRTLRDCKEKLNETGLNLTELSMGMTGDFEIALEEGSTMLRIGTAIFGERNYKR